MNIYEKVRKSYKPNKINYLFIAETPHKKDTDRFFYFENIKDKDGLFIETMKVLYPDEVQKHGIKEVRNKKKIFLEKFKNDGFYLIDSLINPFEDNLSSSQKIQLIRAGQKDLLNRILKIIDDETKVILIAATVYEANHTFLIENGINVINKESIDFPAYSGQIKYREKLSKLLT